MSPSERVGVRELRQNLSVYLRQVKEGRAFEVTERGIPVARLLPPSTGSSALDRLIAEGKVRPGRGKLHELPPPLPAVPGEVTASEALQEQREDRF